MDLSSAHKIACEARLRAHAPYSRYLVGAALVLEDGSIIPGCNVENASYGGTICAERAAFCAAVAQKGKIRPQALVFVTETEAMPCGLCLQVIAEFCSDDFPLYPSTPKDLGAKKELRDFLPHPFRSEKLRG